jgi:hypothetical protein
MNTEIEEIEVKGLIHHSINNNRWTITYDGSGGAIVSNENLCECKREFEEAMELSVVYKSVENFSKGKKIIKIKCFSYSPIKYV